ncbi:MAG: hypothetical protein QOD56_1771 [Gammaproteobacteria bacterium]|jgi:hypothetical protein|nr:hypothetical protein [Gammaproteobacteria bacterium]
MSRKDEDRILHGLHYYRESLDEEFTVNSDQILWLAAHSYADGAHWYKDDDFQSFDSTVVPVELRKKLLTSKFDLPLRYLHHRRLIRMARAGEETVDLAVTFAGADRAMRLHTLFGRMELWYRERRDGLLGLVATIVVSLITALMTVYVVERLRNPVEPPRLIYEIEPKSQR